MLLVYILTLSFQSYDILQTKKRIRKCCHCDQENELSINSTFTGNFHTFKHALQCFHNNSNTITALMESQGNISDIVGLHARQ